MAKDEGIKRFIRPCLLAFCGYAASKSPETLEGKVDVSVDEIIKLDANENLYGCSPKVRLPLPEYLS
jgi:histidinol-phosphate/aromatic aminotransferase/cobyric acid decarboxylase-like protein